MKGMASVHEPLAYVFCSAPSFFGPPTETNFGGCYVSGALDAVEAAARAFTDAVVDVADAPLRAPKP